MQFLIVIFCFFIFFYSLYILGKDDYVLIRKNLSLEQLFDFAFFALFIGVLFAWILLIIFHPAIENDFTARLFSPIGASLSLTGIISGCLAGLYLIGKYRRLPIGRLFDFFSLALLSALPAGYLISIFFIKRKEIFYFIIPGIFYLAAQVFFWRFLLPRIINSRMASGSLCGLFILLFSSVTFFISFFYRFRNSIFDLGTEDYILIGIFLLTVFFMLRNNRRYFLRRKA